MKQLLYAVGIDWATKTYAVGVGMTTADPCLSETWAPVRASAA